MKNLIPGILFTLTVTLSTAQSTIPNNGFENWVMQIGFEDPSNWPSSNYLTLSGTQSNSVFKVSPGYTGTYAARLKSVPHPQNPLAGYIPDTVAVMFSGSIVAFPSPKISGIPFNAKPEKLEWYAKYAPNGADTALVVVLLSKWNATLSRPDTVAIGIQTINNPVATFTKFEATLNYLMPGTAPDTALIMVASSGFNQPKVDSELIVDAFAFTGGDVGYQEIPLSKPQVKHFPNPASDNLTIESNIQGRVTIRIHDITGRQMNQFTADAMKNTVDLKNYSAGLYFYKMTGPKGELLHTGRFNVVK